MTRFPVSVSDHEDQFLFRLFYPTGNPSAVKAAWLPDPSLYARGYVDFLKVPSWLGFPLFYLLTRYKKIDACQDSQVADGPFPLVIFCHGLGAMRTTYSKICTEIASNGYIVCSIEHTDGSACVTKIKDQVIKHKRPNPNEIQQNETKDEYLYRFRREQVLHKASEVEKALEILEKLNSENKLVGKIDMENIGLVGHSFGGATVMTSLQSNNRFKCAVVYDPWMHSVANEKIDIPLMSIQSETFHWRENLDPIKEQFQKDLLHKDSKFLVVKGTGHQDFSDFPFYFGSLIAKMKQSGGDAQEAFEHWSKPTLSYLSCYLKNTNSELAVSERVIVGKEGLEFLEKKL